MYSVNLNYDYDELPIITCEHNKTNIFFILVSKELCLQSERISGWLLSESSLEKFNITSYAIQTKLVSGSTAQQRQTIQVSTRSTLMFFDKTQAANTEKGL